MPHFRVDDNLDGHPKTERAGDDALGLWVRAGSWCMRYLTDGFVPEWWVKKQPNGAKKARKLVAAGFWIDGAERDGEKGYQFHEFVGPGRQDSREKIEADRELARKRKQKSRRESQRDTHRDDHRESHRESRRSPGYTQPNPTQQEISGYVPESATESNARDSIAATPAADLVRATIPSEINSATQTALRHAASTLLHEGAPRDVVYEALHDWATKTGVGPGILPSLAADVVKRRNGHARAAPSSKLRDLAELAQRERRRENAQLTELDQPK
jgi:hypothetical protein